jgi:hypothetical protein
VRARTGSARRHRARRSRRVVIHGFSGSLTTPPSAVRSDGAQAEAEHVEPTRTHGDMLLERRSLAELDVILSERLALLKTGVIGPNACERIAMAEKKKAA